MNDLLSMDMPQLRALVESFGQKPYVAGQLRTWLCKGVPFEEMTNLSRTLRTRLRESCTEGYARTVRRLTAADGTAKYLLEVSGGGYIECVVMRYRHGNTLCVSTQLGCRMGCAFCASGLDGLVRNLTAGEMLSQLIAVEEEISNVVLMGSGEPLDNYDNVVAFIRALQSEFGIGMRRISLSTCGLVPAMKKLAGEGLGITLCLSLHAATDEKRKQIMPVAHSWTVSEVIGAAKDYFQKTGRRIIIEYTLIHGFNDGREDIEALREALRGLNCHINVIPLNEAAGGFVPPSARQAHAFATALEKQGLGATVRRALGGDIEGACGQLRRKTGKL